MLFLFLPLTPPLSTFKVVRNKKLTPWLSCLNPLPPHLSNHCNYWRLTVGPLAKHWLKTQKGEEHQQQPWILKISEEQSQSWILGKYFREGKTLRGLEVVEALGGFNDTMVEMFGAKVDFRWQPMTSSSSSSSSSSSPVHNVQFVQYMHATEQAQTYLKIWVLVSQWTYICPNLFKRGQNNFFLTFLCFPNSRSGISPEICPCVSTLSSFLYYIIIPGHFRYRLKIQTAHCAV